jgi:hypothetical protein
MRYLTEARSDALNNERSAFVTSYRGSALILHTIKGGTLRKTRTRRVKYPQNSLSGQTLIHQPTHKMNGPEGFHDPELIQDRRFHREALILLQDATGGTTKNITIGRVGRCNVVINDYTVSGLHAVFMHQNRSQPARICDKGAKNGSFLNGEKMAPDMWCDIHSGDTICMGRVEMVYIDAKDFYSYLRGDFNNPQLEVAFGN